MSVFDGSDPFLLVHQAFQFAERAHEGQVDKLGEPYISHVSRVMNRVDDPDAKMVAALHDVVEDTDNTPGDLRAAGFPSQVVDAVVAVTRRPDEDYSAFIDRVSANPIARLVKAADLCDNSDESRLTRLPAETAARLRAKYADAIDRLDVGDQIERWRRHDRLE